MSAAPPSPGHVTAGRHRLMLRVYFGETDLSGVVHHAMYLHYLERARTEFLRLEGIDHRSLYEAGQGVWAVRRVTADYLAPARVDDVLTVESRVAGVGAATCDIAQTIRRDSVRLFEGVLTLVWLTLGGRAQRQPEQWRVQFRALMEAAA